MENPYLVGLGQQYDPLWVYEATMRSVGIPPQLIGTTKELEEIANYVRDNIPF